MDLTTTHTADRPATRLARAKHLAERGLTTIEYAIGLLCAAIFALTVFRIFSDNDFFSMLWDWLVGLFQTLIG